MERNLTSPEALLDIVQTATVNILGVSKDAVTLDASFADDLDADSLALVEIITEIEDALDIQVPTDDLKDVKTVGSAVDLLMAKLAAG